MKSPTGKLLGAAVFAPLALDSDVLGMRGSASRDNWGRSVARVRERRASAVLEDAAAKNAEDAATLADTQKKEADRLLEEEEARKKLRAASTGGFASTVLSGGGSGSASSTLSGSRLYGS